MTIQDPSLDAPTATPLSGTLPQYPDREVLEARMLRCCLNPKVLAGLALVGSALWLLSPVSIGAVLPALLVLACPLSMGVMMWRMRSGGSCSATVPGSGGATDADVQVRALRAGIPSLRDGGTSVRTAVDQAAAAESQAAVTQP